MYALLLSLLLSVHALAVTEPVTDKEFFYARKTLVPPESFDDDLAINASVLNENQTLAKELKKAKFFLLNGEVKRARVYLSALTYTDSKLKAIVYRYLAIIHFMEGEFSKSYQFLQKPELMVFPRFAKTCTLLIMNKIVLNRLSEIEDLWERCQLENKNRFAETGMKWVDTLIGLKLHPRLGVARNPYRKMRLAALTTDELKVLLKLGLYLNQEELIVPQLNDLEKEQIMDPEVREIVAQIYYRNGNLQKAAMFISDLKSPNAETIRGNLYLLQTKYELAYAQFKLALERKQNSQNAMERLLPLAWILQDWENGTKYAERVIASPQSQINKLTLVAAFATQKGDYERAQKVLDSINQTSRKGSEKDVAQLSSFAGLMQNRPDQIKKYASASCDQYDLVNCWLMLQMYQWDSFPLTVRSEEPVVKDERLWQKYTTEVVDEPLKETPYVNQLDIEEMDDKDIQLQKGT